MTNSPALRPLLTTLAMITALHTLGCSSPSPGEDPADLGNDMQQGVVDMGAVTPVTRAKLGEPCETMTGCVDGLVCEDHGTLGAIKLGFRCTPSCGGGSDCGDLSDTHCVSRPSGLVGGACLPSDVYRGCDAALLPDDYCRRTLGEDLAACFGESCEVLDACDNVECDEPYVCNADGNCELGEVKCDSWRDCEAYVADGSLASNACSIENRCDIVNSCSEAIDPTDFCHRQFGVGFEDNEPRFYCNSGGECEEVESRQLYAVQILDLTTTERECTGIFEIAPGADIAYVELLSPDGETRGWGRYVDHREGLVSANNSTNAHLDGAQPNLDVNGCPPDEVPQLFSMGCEGGWLIVEFLDEDFQRVIIEPGMIVRVGEYDGSYCGAIAQQAKDRYEVYGCFGKTPGPGEDVSNANCTVSFSTRPLEGIAEVTVPSP